MSNLYVLCPVCGFTYMQLYLSTAPLLKIIPLNGLSNCTDTSICLLPHITSKSTIFAMSLGRSLCQKSRLLPEGGPKFWHCVIPHAPSKISNTVWILIRGWHLCRLTWSEFSPTPTLWNSCWDLFFFFCSSSFQLRVECWFEDSIIHSYMVIWLIFMFFFANCCSGLILGGTPGNCQNCSIIFPLFFFLSVFSYWDFSDRYCKKSKIDNFSSTFFQTYHF